MHSIRIIPVLLIIATFLSCGTEQKSDLNGGTPNQQRDNNLVDTISQSLIGTVVQHYLHLENALVSSNADEAKAGAKGLIAAIRLVDTLKFSNEQKVAWQQHIGLVKENAAHFLGAELTLQREHLSLLSEALWGLVSEFGGGEVLYYNYCPMANNNKGGHWLSEEEEIKNPYFGDEMLNCGETKETIKKSRW